MRVYTVSGPPSRGVFVVEPGSASNSNCAHKRLDQAASWLHIGLLELPGTALHWLNTAHNKMLQLRLLLERQTRCHYCHVLTHIFIMSLPTKKQRTASIQRYTVSDILQQLSPQQKQQYTALVDQYNAIQRQHNATNCELNIADSNVLHQQMTQCADTVHQIQRIVHCYTNIDSIDTFKPNIVAQQAQSQLLSLSDDVLISVLQYLEIGELLQLRAVSVQLRALVFHTEVWKYQHRFANDMQLLCWHLRLSDVQTLCSDHCVAEYLTAHRTDHNNLVLVYLRHRLQSMTSIVHRHQNEDEHPDKSVTVVLHATPNVRHVTLLHMLINDTVLHALQSLQHLRTFASHLKVQRIARPNGKTHSMTLHAFTSLCHTTWNTLVLHDRSDVQHVNVALLQQRIDEYQQLNNSQVMLFSQATPNSFNYNAVHLISKPGTEEYREILRRRFEQR